MGVPVPLAGNAPLPSGAVSFIPPMAQGPIGNPTHEIFNRLLRDRIQTHDINIAGAGLDLGTRDDRDAI